MLGYQGPFLFFLESLQCRPEMLKDQETRGQEMPQQRHLWNPFWRTSRLGNIFLNCQSKRIPGIPAFRLEKLYGDYCHHKYRVNGTGQSLNIKTIKNTLARNLSQYHNTHTLTMNTNLLKSNFNAFYYTVNEKSSGKYVHLSTSSM